MRLAQAIEFDPRYSWQTHTHVWYGAGLVMKAWVADILHFKCVHWAAPMLISNRSSSNFCAFGTNMHINFSSPCMYSATRVTDQSKYVRVQAVTIGYEKVVP